MTAGGGVRIAFLSGALPFMLTPRGGDIASLGECWRKCVLEGMMSTEAHRSERGWHT